MERPHQQRVLLVDDDQDLREALADLLTHRGGFEVTSAPDVATAIRFLSEKSFDVVLTDGNMPGLSGADLIDVLKRDFPSLPVVLMSGSPIMRSLGVVKGACDVLEKPFSLPEVLGTLGRAIA